MMKKWIELKVIDYVIIRFREERWLCMLYDFLCVGYR